MRTAVILLALLAVAAIPGSVLPQRNVATDPMSVVVFAGDHPTLYPWLDRLGMFDVYASPWFAAIYLLLLVSMTGCVLPRCLRLWRAVRTPPPPAPRTLGRFEGYRSWESDRDPDALLADARTVLRKHRFRVVSTPVEVRAERGYLREVGNLLFHLSLLVLLFGVAAGRLLGFEGRVALAEGSSFTNVRAEYDVFTPSVWTDSDNLEPFSMTLDDFEVEYEMEGSKSGEPRLFAADVSYATGLDGAPRQVEVRPNNPLDVNETKMFLTGHGYAPRVTVRDGTGSVVFAGPVIFLPNDATYASDGVVKAPDAQPTQLGFEGFFLPTSAVDERGPYSAFPDALDPQLVLTAYTGDLGLGSGQHSPCSPWTSPP
ncbi:ResB family protein [Nocardioides sp. PD653-B2]|nr:cytochrome c biogenesis protein ResB [Nocardioides sp. PD653]GAW49777.1 ResB family protein [Nocardioides sp. PD653-B2]